MGGRKGFFFVFLFPPFPFPPTTSCVHHATHPCNHTHTATAVSCRDPAFHATVYVGKEGSRKMGKCECGQSSRLTRCSSSADTASHFTPMLPFPSTFEPQIHKNIMRLSFFLLTSITSMLQGVSCCSSHGTARIMPRLARIIGAVQCSARVNVAVSPIPNIEN